MANKNNKKNSNGKKTQTKSVKLTKTTATILIAAILLAAIACITMYFGFPDTWNKFTALFFGGNHSTSLDGNLPEGKMNFAKGDLSVHYLNVGQGDCILILFPDGRDMIIDCGNKSSNYKFQDTSDYLDMYITDKQLDFLMLTHADEDHVEFLDNVITNYQVDNIFMPNIKATPTNTDLATKVNALPVDKLKLFTDPDTVDTAVYAEFFIAALTEPNCYININMDDDVNTNNIKISGSNLLASVLTEFNFTFYSPTKDYYENSNLSNAEKKNAVSPIGILEYNNFKLVFTGDSNEINEPLFIDRLPLLPPNPFGTHYLDCDVLKVGHHGSETSSTDAFLSAINCEYAVISCNASGNTYKHPRQATLDRLVAHKANIIRTDNNGTIVLVVNQKLTFFSQMKINQSTNRIGLR